MYLQSTFRIQEIRVYECPNLLSLYAGRVSITPDTTSCSVTGFEAQNLITNLENRTCTESRNPIDIAETPSSAAVLLGAKSCFVTTDI